MKREADGPRAVRLLLFLLLLPAAAQAAPGPWDDPAWLRLVHYKRARWTGAWVGDASDGFYASPRGRTDPRAEYEASLAALAAPDPGDGKHFSCRFPARTAWLAARAGVAPAKADCSKYEDWRRLLDAGSVSLIFASAYMDNPSSMFGHTFLRLERRATGGDPLRDNTLNFAAETGADGGVAFAVKGLLGLYPGKYTAMPYYMKIAEYNDMENRDLWEYRLELSSAEVDRLAAHAWELGQGTFPYYFFSKNCSYQLMPTLEAAAPRLSLMDGSPAIVGPADTLHAARDTPGLAPAAVYRPSHATTMAQRRALLTGPERRASEAYAAGRFAEGDAMSAAWPSARRALVLDAASDHILYKKGFSPDVPPEVRELERGVLVRRAKVPEPPQELAPPPWAAPPDEGHLRHRVQVGYGARNGGSFVEVSWRPGYHDLLDRPHGYPPGAAIEGSSARLRYDRDDRRVSVRDARLVEILSAAPWDPWAKQPSWSAGTGLETAFEKGRPADRALVYEGHSGAGSSVALGPVLFYGLLQAEGSAGSVLRDGFAVGGSLRAGAAAAVTPSVNVLLDGALNGRAWGDRTPDHRVRAALNWAPARDLSLRLDGLVRGPHRELGLYATAHY